MRPTVAIPSRPRPGIAIVVVLVALSVVGALAAGTFLIAWRDLGAGVASMHRARAFSAAEFGLLAALGEWDPRWTAAPPGLVALQRHSLGDDTSDTVRVWRLASSSAMLVSSSVAAGTRYAAQRRLNLLVALHPLGVSVPAALMVRDEAAVRGGSQVLGTDAADRDADCPPDSSARAAIAAPDSAVVDTAACGAAPCIAGAPAILVTTLAAAPDLATSVGIDRGALIAGALPIRGTPITPGPTQAVDGGCDVDDPLNFGDPVRALGDTSPCARWAAPRYATGDVRMDGGVGQGILIVDGNLTLSNGARFAGIALVYGALRIEGGSRLDGAVIAQRAVVDEGSAVHFASCAIDRARRGAAQPSREAGFSWVEQN